MTISELIRSMTAAGAPMEAVMIAVEAVEAANKALEEEREKAREADRARVRKYRVRRQLPEGAWLELRAEVFTRDGYACVYCGSNQRLHADHVIPLAKGGTNHIENLATSCARCNQSKGAKYLAEWRGHVS